MTAIDLLRSCETYETAPPGSTSATELQASGHRPDTCIACGGDGQDGPTALCPSWGERGHR